MIFIKVAISVLSMSVVLCHAVFATSLVNQLNSFQSFPLKWKTRIGLTTYRTTIQFANNHIIVPSNGRSYKSRTDSLDGVLIINPKNGDIKKKIVHSKNIDRDVNGVAVSATKIVFGDDNETLNAYDWSGNLLWSVKAYGDFESAPALTQINNDSILDVVAATEAGELMAIDGATGDIIWAFQTGYPINLRYPSERGFMASPTLFDVNEDGIRDVLIGSRNGNFFSINGKEGNLLWKYITKTPSGIFSSSFCDKKHIVFAESYANVYKLSILGRYLQTIPLKPIAWPQIVSSPIITPDNSLFVGTTFDKSENGIWRQANYQPERFTPSGKVSASPIVANIDDSKGLEIMMLDEEKTLFIYDEQGHLKGQFDLGIGGEASPLIADIDNDNKLELLIALKDQYLYCYDLESSGPVYWGSFRGNPYNTGVLYDVLDEDQTDPLIKRPGVFSPSFTLSGYDYNDWFSTDTNLNLISKNGIGQARIGLTISQFKTLLGDKASYKMVDLGIGMKAMAVIFNEAVQYYLLFPEVIALNDMTKIAMVITNNSDYQTIEGFRPGDSIKMLSEKLGYPTISSRKDNNVEELFRFPRQDSWMIFANYSAVKSGIYDPNKEFRVTKLFQKGSKIQFFGVR